MTVSPTIIGLPVELVYVVPLERLPATFCHVCPYPTVLEALVANVAVAAFPPIERPDAVPVMFVPTNALGVPNAGVTKVGLVDNTTFPEPVLVVTPVPPLAAGKVPVTPVVKGRPVQLVKVPDVGVPNAGVTRVGEVLNTLLPEPVLVVTPVPPLETPNVPVTPVVSGKPVAFVSTAAEGVPNAGVTRVGEVLNTTFPDPVLVVTPVPPLATGKVPVTPVESGRPVAFVSTAAEGVPNAGVTRVGEVLNTLLPEPVLVVTPVPPLETPNVPVTPVVSGKPVAFVSTPDAGVPSAGVVNVGLTARTTAPVPVAVVTPVPPDVTGSALAKTPSVAVIVPAAKFPDPSRYTRVFAVFVDA